jgi:polyisoprenoid-binding protein YceI
VAGELSVNLDDLSTTQVGVLQINARALLTDNNFRNRAIQNQILETNEFEFITFTPTAVNGLPASAQVGETVQFSIAGDLTIRDITQPVEFTVEATPMTKSQLVGTASTIINRVNFDLNIPSAPGVANVEEEVELYIDFVANAS